MAYNPEYDPNFNPTRKKHSQYNMIFQGSGFAPGSTFKIVTAATGLMAGFTPDESIPCDGYITLGKTKFWCDQKWGHGNENFSDAMTHSCNIYFYTWGRRAGAGLLCKMARGFGFGAPTDFDVGAARPRKGRHVADPVQDTIQAGLGHAHGHRQGEMIGGDPHPDGARLRRPVQRRHASAPAHRAARLHGPDDRQTSMIEQVDGGPLAGRAGPSIQGKLPVSADARRRSWTASTASARSPRHRPAREYTRPSGTSPARPARPRPADPPPTAGSCATRRPRRRRS